MIRDEATPEFWQDGGVERVKDHYLVAQLVVGVGVLGRALSIGGWGNTEAS